MDSIIVSYSINGFYSSTHTRVESVYTIQYPAGNIRVLFDRMLITIK